MTAPRTSLARVEPTPARRQSEAERESRPTILLAGALPHDTAGNAVSTEVLMEALERIGTVRLLTHRASPLPTLRGDRVGDRDHLRLGVQTYSIHGEALLGGWLHRRRLRACAGAWAVNSRYAGALHAAGIPYALWEATTTRDELRAIDWRAIRRGGSSGAGNLLHRALLPIGERLEGWLYRGAAAIAAMSAYTRAHMVETHGLAPERIAIVPHPPTSAFLAQLDALTHDGVRRGRTHTMRLLFVGRLADPRKNVQLLLDVHRALRAEGMPIELTLIGPYTEAWRRTSGVEALSDSIHLRGRVSIGELAEAYLTHDVLIVPSRQEGFGIVVAEAMHAGLPVVSTFCGGPEQVIGDSAGGGILVPDARAMVEALRALLGDRPRRMTMGQRGLEFARRALDHESFASRIAGMTEMVLAARPQRQRA